ncbi:MAG: Succinyl-CoA ligase [ADP-forming] alpha chain, partial [uncultured Gemmatimonadetes bacterium]
EHLHRQRHAPGGAGDHGPRRLVPRQADDGVRHPCGGRRDPRKGRAEVRGAGAHLQHRRRGGEGRGRQHLRDLRAAGLRRRRHVRGRRRGDRVHRLHHRGRAGAGHDPRTPLRDGKGRPPAGPQLPGPAFGRQEQGGDHPRPHYAAGARRPGVQERHADVRGGLQAQGRRHRHHHLRGDRRRPHQRHLVHRLPGGLRGGPGNEGHRDAGRDRRHGRAGRGALHQGERHQAGGGLHRGPDGASGAPHGARGRHHQRLGRHRRREDPGVPRQRHRRGAAPRGRRGADPGGAL